MSIQSNRQKMTRRERREELKCIVKGCISNLSKETNRARMCWKVGDPTILQVTDVCKNCFCNVYGVSLSHVDEVVREVKSGICGDAPKLSDRTPGCDKHLLAGLRRIARSYGIHLTQRQVAAAAIPNSPLVLTAFGWMNDHFKMVGDYMPNLGGEIHLEPIHIVEIYGEYRVDIESAGIRPVHVDTFAKLWINCFPFVKIREFKAVCSTCSTCSTLSSLRRTFKSQKQREYVTMMHALHRTTYMGERALYAERRNRAVMQPSQYLSGKYMSIIWY